MSILLLFKSSGGGGGVKTSSKAAWLIGLGNLLVPDGNAGNLGTWINELGNDYDIYLSVDEANANDSDFIYDTSPVTGNYYEFSLSSPAGIPSGDVVVFWRGQCSTIAMTVQVQLRQGSDTIIAQASQALSEGFRTYYLQLTPSEKANITDWNDLRLRITETVS